MAKATRKGDDDQVEAATIRVYRNPRTGALRRSRSFLGLPYQEVDAEEVARLDAEATEQATDEAGGARGPDET